MGRPSPPWRRPHPLRDRLLEYLILLPATLSCVHTARLRHECGSFADRPRVAFWLGVERFSLFIAQLDARSGPLPEQSAATQAHTRQAAATAEPLPRRRGPTTPTAAPGQAALAGSRRPR